MVAPFNDSPAALSRLIHEIIDVIASEYKEVVNAGTRALNSLTGKIFNKLMDESLDILEATFEEADDATATKRYTYFLHLIEC